MKKTNLLLSVAVSSLLATSAQASGNADKKASAKKTSGNAVKVKCVGINECKGKSACHVKDSHACNGQNKCKGKAMIKVSKAECLKKKGTIQK